MKIQTAFCVVLLLVLIVVEYGVSSSVMKDGMRMKREKEDEDCSWWECFSKDDFKQKVGAGIDYIKELLFPPEASTEIPDSSHISK
jgi:cellobiose-specific phosphotransferase system component IIB